MKIAIAGCTGRMGLTLLKNVLQASDLTLIGGSERKGYDEVAARAQLTMIGCEGISITTDPKVLASQAQAIIDFTSPEASLLYAEAAAELGLVHIIGTTGFSVGQLTKLKSYATKARIVLSGNFSLGVNLLEQLVEHAAKALHESYDIEITEMHHKYKKDAPSGTALMLGNAAARGRGVALDSKKILDRNGERKTGDIGFAVQRGGDVVGIHSVMFAGQGELIELRHQAFSRDIYASGALHAARWAQHQPAGLYSMRDVVSAS